MTSHLDSDTDVETRLHLPPAARELLIAHGWTPPTREETTDGPDA